MELGELDRLRLGLRFDRPLELRLEAGEPALGLGELRLRVAEVLAHDVEVGPEAGEVAVEVGDVGHDLARVLLDLEALEALGEVRR